MSIPTPKKYIADFENLGMGMFVHWGLYSQIGEGEWAQFHQKIPKEEYMKLKDTFTAEDFDAEELVLTAKEAGCKYITLTTRHHEGFSLYDTCGLSDYDAPHSPAGRDLVREFVDACNKFDIIPFFYHTTLDWYHEAYNKNFDEYLEYLRQSVEILCKNYGKIGGLWFDGNWDKPDSDWKLDELYGTIRKYQPDAMIINNTGLQHRGEIIHPEIDSVTYEQGRPSPMNREGMPKYLAAEMCYTINDCWGIGKTDLNYKPPKELIEALCECRKVGANYLINLGPTAQGKVNTFDGELFKIIGKWMSVYGEAIYNGRPHPAFCNCRDFILKSTDGNSLYIFAIDLGRNGSKNVVVGGKYAGAVAFNDVKEEITSIKWMDSGEELSFLQGDGMLCVNLSGYKYGDSYTVRVAKATIKK